MRGLPQRKQMAHTITAMWEHLLPHRAIEDSPCLKQTTGTYKPSGSKRHHYIGKSKRVILPPGTSSLGRHHFLRSSGDASDSGGHAPPLSTASTSCTVRGHNVRFSTKLSFSIAAGPDAAVAV
mmetsp:Transcript_150/g.189  ORF Transcript_150/g.189 Transcript_150/m.189 type:complete len:123 (-) Transcript_150:658-1026(-)